MRMCVRRPVRNSCFVPIIHSLAPVTPSSESNFTEQKVALYLEDGNSFFFSYEDKKEGGMNISSGSSVSSSPPATTSQLIAKTVMLESHSAR